MVLDCLLDDNSLGEVLLRSLIMDCHGGAVEHLLLAETKAVLAWVELPFVVPLFLLAWVEVAVSSLVHFLEPLFVITGIGLWIEDFLGVHESLGVNSEGVLGLVADFVSWPVVTSLVTLAEWFSDVGCVVVLLDVVELVLHACQVLRLDHLVDVLGVVSFLAVGVVRWERKLVVCDAIVPLNHSGLVDVGFSKLFEVFWSPWPVVSVNILSNAVIS